MNYDRHLYPATDQHLPSADDSSYSECNTREDEGLRGRYRGDGIEPYPSDLSNDLARYHTTPAHASNDGRYGFYGPGSHIRLLNPVSTVTSGETSSSARQYLTDEIIDSTESCSPAQHDVEDWSRHTQDLEWQEITPVQLPQLTWVDLLLDDTHQSTHWVGSDEHASQNQTQEHPESQYMGMELGQMDWPMTSVTNPELSINRLLSPIIEQPYVASDASSMIVEPSICGNAKRSLINGPASSEYCPHSDCDAAFHGAHARGNLARHRRLRHRFFYDRTYVCEEPGCSNSYKRQDARLKHYRKHHPHRASDLVIRRPTRARDQGDYHVSGKTRNAEDAMNEIISSTLSEPTTEVAPTDVGSIQCDICRKEFNRAAELRRHKKSIHNLNSQQYFCTVPGCDRASRPFLRKDKLADHTARVHTQSTASEAFEHGEEVSEATYRCDHEGCAREFDQRADLLRHQRTHTDKSERPHKCARCAKSFLYPKDLKRHQATHLDDEDGDKPSFHCEVASCDYGPGKQGFSRKDGMIRHMRRFHPELIADEET